MNYGTLDYNIKMKENYVTLDSVLFFIYGGNTIMFIQLISNFSYRGKNDIYFNYLLTSSIDFLLLILGTFIV